MASIILYNDQPEIIKTPAERNTKPITLIIFILFYNPNNSTSKIKVAFGGIDPEPFSP